MVNRERVLKKVHQIKMILLVVLIAAIIGVPAFAYFRIRSEARLALREAKNVKLAITMLDIEYYGQGSCIYDSSQANGLKNGAEEEIWDTLGFQGQIILQSYNKSKRTVNAMVYTNDHYQVTYYNDSQEGDSWEVRYFIKVLD
jgi:hypothetical protein